MNKVKALGLALTPIGNDFSRSWKLALDLNNTIHTFSSESFRFDENHLPHITLWQGAVAENHLEEICKFLSTTDLPKNFTINVSKFIKGHRSSSLPNFHTCLLEIVNGPLQFFHEKLSKKLESYRTNDDFLHPNQNYIGRFGIDCSKDKYYPHITLGFSREHDIEKIESQFTGPFSITDYQLTLAELGPHCTISKNQFWTRIF